MWGIFFFLKNHTHQLRQYAAGYIHLKTVTLYAVFYLNLISKCFVAERLFSICRVETSKYANGYYGIVFVAISVAIDLLCL